MTDELWPEAIERMLVPDPNMTIDDAMPWNAVTDDDEDYDCPTYRKFGHCACSTGVLGSACPNQYVGDEDDLDPSDDWGSGSWSRHWV